MPEYTLIVQIPNAGNKEFRHTLNLPNRFVDFPSDYFRNPENRDKLQKDIETQSGRQVTDADLEMFIKEWCRDIRQGLSPTTVSRELPPLIGTLSSPFDNSRRNNPETFTGSNSGAHIPKQPKPLGVSGTSAGGQSQSSSTGNTQQEKEEPPKTETWSTNNDTDF